MLVSEYGCLHVFLILTCNPEWPEIQSQLIIGQTAFDCPDVTVPVFKSRLDKFKTNIRNGEYFESPEVIYIIHVREYQYRGLPHAHMVFCLDNAHDIDADNQDDLIDFVDKNFIAELPQFKREGFQNIHWWDNDHELTDNYKANALEMVHKHNNVPLL